MSFKPSKYQKKIFDFITKGVGNAVINAKAGSGKTTTLVEAMKLIPQKERALFVAFNKSIEQELKSRLSEYDNVDVRTYHGLGYAILRENLRGYKFNVSEYKYMTYINKYIYDISPNVIALNKTDFNTYKNNIKLLVDFARFNLSQSLNEIEGLCIKYSITPLMDECHIVLKILEWGKEHLDEIDYTDMIWLCIEKDLETKRYKTDFIFIDEAQDSSIMQQTLIKKCYKRGTRFIAIGDEFQCINAFAGADQEAFNKFKKEPNTIVLELPITYRCPKNIVDYAIQLTGVDMKAAPKAISGEIRRDVSPFEPKDNDMVLCRNTAHLVKLYMKYNRINKKSYLKGRNIGDTFKTLIERTNQNKLSLDMKFDGVFPRLYEHLFNTINKEITLTGLEYEDVVNTQKIMDLVDSIKALEALSEGINFAQELINKINVIFTDNEKDGICLSTIHKAKGLEADNVFILCESLMPSKHARKKWEIESEQNLIYVAITRAKKTLNYISEKMFPANLFGNNENIITELEYQRVRMNNALNIDSQILTVSNLTREEQISEDVKQLMNMHNKITKTTDNKKRKNIGGNKFSKFLN